MEWAGSEVRVIQRRESLLGLQEDDELPEGRRKKSGLGEDTGVGLRRVPYIQEVSEGQPEGWSPKER